MESHISTGCANCATSLRLWSSLQSAAVNEKIYAPPEQLLRRLTLEFAARYPSKAFDFGVARLVFDSLTLPLTAGVRAGAHEGVRQLVYEGAGLTVDLRVEKESKSNKVCAVGQILCNQGSEASPSAGSVALWTAQGQPIATTNPNQHGEFQLEFKLQDRLHLSIAMPGRTTVRFPLPELEVTTRLSPKVT